MRHPPQAPVVVGVDGSPRSGHAMEWAVGEALRRGVALRVVHAFPTDPPVAVGHDPDIRAAAERMLTAAADDARNLPGANVEVQAAVVEGSAAKVLLDESLRASLLVVGSRGHGGFASLLLGSTSVHVTAHAGCPVVVVPHHETAPGTAEGPVLVGVDGSPASTPALEFAFERAQRRGVGLVAVHVWRVPTDYGAYPVEPVKADSARLEREARARLADAVAPWLERYPQVSVDQPTIQGHPARVLTEESTADAELVVVGSRGHATLTGTMLGSVSQAVLHHTRRPVAVVR